MDIVGVIRHAIRFVRNLSFHRVNLSLHESCISTLQRFFVLEYFVKVITGTHSPSVHQMLRQRNDSLSHHILHGSSSTAFLQGKLQLARISNWDSKLVQVGDLWKDTCYMTNQISDHPGSTDSSTRFVELSRIPAHIGQSDQHQVSS